MNATIKISSVAVLALLNVNSALAQGCSDAGFCTIGALKANTTSADSTLHKFSVLLPVGQGDAGVLVFAPALQYDRRLSARWAAQAKLTANYAQGDLGRVAGPGDVFLAATYTLPGRSDRTTAFTVGTKLPLNNADLRDGGRPLPMQYQNSLGTVDLITGVSINGQRWQGSVGWQQPLSGANGNTFLPEPDTRPATDAYPPSNEFRRAADVLARVGYALLHRPKATLNAGLLGIYHLTEDTYRGQNGQLRSITGSKGLTLNITLVGSWAVGSRLHVGFSGGVPLVVRAVRPDGLTRSVVFAPEVSWRF